MASESVFAKLIDLVKNGKNAEIECIIKNSRPSHLIDYAGVTLLHLAARYNNLDLIDILLSVGYNIDSKTCSGATPLLMSAVHGSYDAVKHLLDADANVLAVDDNNVSVLRVLLNPRRKVPADVFKHVGNRLRKTIKSPSVIVRLFREAGGRPESVILINDPQVVKCMLSREEEVDNDTSVELAVELGHVEALEVLVRFGHEVPERRNTLMKKLSTIMTSPKPNLDLMKPIVEKLISWFVVNEAAVEPLKKIFSQGSQEAVQMLIDCDIDLHVRGSLGRDFLKHMFGNPNVDVLELLKNRFDPNEQDIDGYSLLHLAVIFKPMSFVQRVLDLRADLNIKDRDGRTALFYVTDADCMELLLRSGADIQAIDDEGNTMVAETREDPLLLELVLCHLAHRKKFKRKVLDDIDNDEEVKKTFDDLRAQIQWMTKQKIHKEKTLYTLLESTDDEELMAYPVKTRDAVESTLSFMRKRRFSSYYVAKLERKLTRAFEFHEMRFEIAEVVAGLIRVGDSNHLVVEKVVKFLKCEDILACVMFSK